MVKMTLGNKPGVGGVVKITYDNNVDAMTLDSVTDHAEFKFDSEKSRLGYIYEIDSVSNNTTLWPFPGSNGNSYYKSPATGVPQWGILSRRAIGGTYTQAYWINASLYGLEYQCMVEARAMSSTDTRRVLASGNYRLSSNTSSGRALYLLSSQLGYAGFSARSQSIASYSAFWGGGAPAFSNLAPGPADGTLIKQFTLWDLPATNAALPTDGVASPGSVNVILSPAVVKIARPGYDIADPNPSHAVIDSNRIPAKILECGITTVTGGGTSVVNLSTPFAVTADCYVDAHCGNTAWNYFMYPTLVLTSSGAAVGYKIDTALKTITFTNDFPDTMRVVWFLLADDNTNYTSGGNDVVKVGNDGVQDYVQIKRPGSSDVAPSLNDIMLDTRLQPLSIAAEGWIPAADMIASPSDELSFGDFQKDIFFDNDGSWTPFVKYSWVGTDGITFAPYVRRLQHTGGSGAGSAYNNRHLRDSSCARVFANKIRFYTSHTQALQIFYDFDTGAISGQYYGAFYLDDPANPSAAGTPYPNLAGLRYYVFRLPVAHPF